MCLRPFASDVECMAQLAVAHAPAEAGAAKSVRGVLGLAEATGERVRCFVMRCGWSMRRTLCGTSGPFKKKEEKARRQCIARYAWSTVARKHTGTIAEVRPYWVWVGGPGQ